MNIRPPVPPGQLPWRYAPPQTQPQQAQPQQAQPQRRYEARKDDGIKCVCCDERFGAAAKGTVVYRATVEPAGVGTHIVLPDRVTSDTPTYQRTAPISDFTHAPKFVCMDCWGNLCEDLCEGLNTGDVEHLNDLNEAITNIRCSACTSALIEKEDTLLITHVQITHAKNPVPGNCYRFVGSGDHPQQFCYHCWSWVHERIVSFWKNI